MSSELHETPVDPSSELHVTPVDSNSELHVTPVDPSFEHSRLVPGLFLYGSCAIEG